MSVFINDIMTFSFLGEGLLFVLLVLFFFFCWSSIYILTFLFFIDFFFLLLCTTTIVNGVYCGNRSSSMFLWRIDGWFIKGQIHKGKPLSLSPGVWWYFGVCGWWDNGRGGGVILFVRHQTASPLPPLSLCVNLKLNEWVWAVVAILQTVSTP